MGKMTPPKSRTYPLLSTVVIITFLCFMGVAVGMILAIIVPWLFFNASYPGIPSFQELTSSIQSREPVPATKNAPKGPVAQPPPYPPANVTENPPKQPQKTEQAQPSPDPDPGVTLGTPHKYVLFQPSDCACGIPSMPDPKGITAGSGGLDCSYSWSGTYIDNNSAEIEIWQYDDPAQFAEVYDQALEDTHFSADNSVQDARLNTIRNDPTGFTFIHTYPGGMSDKTNTEIPLCGNGHGALGVDNAFVARLRLFSCDISDDWNVYVETMEKLEDCALAAIARAQSQTNP